jgi:dihydrofolate synthase/folylpolyglutamate synthase
MDAVTLARQCTTAGLKGEIVAVVGDAVRIAIEKASVNDVIFIGGSTYVVAELKIE